MEEKFKADTRIRDTRPCSTTIEILKTVQAWRRRNGRRFSLSQLFDEAVLGYFAEETKRIPKKFAA